VNLNIVENVFFMRKKTQSDKRKKIIAPLTDYKLFHSEIDLIFFNRKV
jgi:hypothetical protein